MLGGLETTPYVRRVFFDRSCRFVDEIQVFLTSTSLRDNINNKQVN